MSPPSRKTSKRRPSSKATTGPRATEHRPLDQRALVFAALGDATRLALVEKLSDGSRLSITRLAAGGALTRQAITKHLGVLQDVGVVRGVREGRENRFELNPKTIRDARQALDRISRHWDDALGRLKTFIEESP